MGQVTIELNNRTYRFACRDGDEARLEELAQHVRERVDALVGQHGQAGDDRLLLMAAIMLADELSELQERGTMSVDDAET